MVGKHNWFWDILRRYIPLYRHVLVASVVVNCLSLAMPLFIMNVYDRIVPNNAFESLWVLAIGMGLAASLDFALRMARIHFVDIVGRNADIKLQSAFMHSIFNARFNDLYSNKDTASVGAIISRVRELEYVRDFLGSSTFLALTDLPFIIFFILLTFYIGGMLGFIPLFAIPILVLFAFLTQKVFARNSQKQMHANAQKQSFLSEIINSLETIRATRMEKSLLQDWRKKLSHASDTTIHAHMQTSFNSYGIVLFNMLLTISLVIAGVYAISKGNMTSGGLIACVILFGRTASPMNGLVNIISNYHKTLLALEQMDKLLHLPSENPNSLNADQYDMDYIDSKDIVEPDYPEEGLEDYPEDKHFALPASTIAVPIVFERVTFSYPSSRCQTTALKDINMIIRPGAKIGFVGSSGSGKSTLARLCAGLYLANEGRVLLGTLDMKHTPMRSFRNQIGFLPQEIRIFRGTLRYNIAMAWPHDYPYEEKDIINAANIAGVMDFAGEHPLGLDMPLGDQGTGLSGGQAQCVALARALLGNPHTLILDEPAAQLDNASALRLVDRLGSYIEGKTILIFTHKASLLNLVDKVIVLDKGRLVSESSREKFLS